MSDEYRLNTNPHSFLMGKLGVQMGDVPYQQALSIPNWVQKNGDLWNYRSDVYFTLGYMDTPVKKISPNYSSLKSPVTFLPYYPDTVCFMCIPGNVDAFCTSQLTGCVIYVCSADDAALGVPCQLQFGNICGRKHEKEARSGGQSTQWVARVGTSLWSVASQQAIPQAMPPALSSGSEWREAPARPGASIFIRPATAW